MADFQSTPHRSQAGSELQGAFSLNSKEVEEDVFYFSGRLYYYQQKERFSQSSYLTNEEGAPLLCSRAFSYLIFAFFFFEPDFLFGRFGKLAALLLL